MKVGSEPKECDTSSVHSLVSYLKEVNRANINVCISIYLASYVEFSTLLLLNELR